MKILHPIFMLVLVTSLAGPAVGAVPGKKKPVPLPPVPVAPAPAPAAAPEIAPDRRSELDKARGQYDAAKFGEAVATLDRALHDGLVTGDDVIGARALRARCLVKLGRRLEAKEGFKAVLRIDRAFRLDAALVPPDEMDSFRLAAQEIDSEQLEAGRRFPASIAFAGGRGQAVNQDLADLASSAGVAQADDFKEKNEFSYSVRFPLKPGLSVDFEVAWLKAETSDKLPADRNNHTTTTASAMPVMVSVVKNLSTSPSRHVNVFAGAGPVICQAILEDRNSLVAGRIIPTQIVGHNQGWGAQAGIEVEQMLRPRLALAVQGRARRLDSGTLHWLRSDYEIYESWPASKLGERSIDFSGIAASIGLRAYIGY